MPPSGLPIDEALPGLRAALSQHSAAVLVAPPGAGKTTVVPLELLAEPWIAAGKIVVLEPRRLAARAAAERMAATLGEPVGQTVGFRVRMQSKVSAATRIEVVTEGVFTRMILSDPELAGVACVIFDEFHERSLDADLGLALAPGRGRQAKVVPRHLHGGPRLAQPGRGWGNRRGPARGPRFRPRRGPHPPGHGPRQPRRRRPAPRPSRAHGARRLLPPVG